MKVILLSPVVHNGQEHAEGDTVDIKDEAQALALIEIGAAEGVQSGKKAKAEAKAEAEAPAAEQSAEG